MKKIYLLTFSLFALSHINAQTSYTLTQANSEPVVGDWFVSVSLDTNGVALPSMNVSGTNQTWNVTGVTVNTSVVNTYTFATNADSSAYPGVNVKQTDSTTTSYFKSSAGMLELLGVDGGQFVLNYNAGSATIATYPVSYGYSNTDNTIGGDITVSTFGGTFTGSLTTMADATGVLNINGGSNFTNCLRIKTVQHIDFNVLFGLETGTIDQEIYNFYHSSSLYPVFTVSYSHVVGQGQFPIDQMQAQVTTLSTVVIGVKENQLNDVIFKTYPNPANSEVNLHFVLAQPESYVVEISNALGQAVKTINLVNLQAGVYNQLINTSDLGAGIYTVKVSGKNRQGTEKLIIQK
ncbi:MAG: T9SS type A sorting domain-containing protein [Bacteroidota bacterium]